MRSVHTFMLSLALLPSLVRADIAVIVHAANPVKSMNQQQVSDLYLGRTRVFPGGEYALVFDLPRDAALREKFFFSLAGMVPQQVNAYWSRLMFTGQVMPPHVLPNEGAALELVRRNPGAIAYVHSDSVDASVRVILRLKE